MAAEGPVCGGFKSDNELLVQKLTAEDFRVRQVQLLLAGGRFPTFQEFAVRMQDERAVPEKVRVANFSEYRTIVTSVFLLTTHTHTHTHTHPPSSGLASPSLFFLCSQDNCPPEPDEEYLV